MKHALGFAAFLVLLVPLCPAAAAAEPPSDELCTVGDRGCLTEQHAKECNPAVSQAAARCTRWLQRLALPPLAADRAAQLARANAYATIALFLSKDPVEQSSAKSASRTLYRSLVDADPSDPDALLGLATATDVADEKLQLLRKVVQLQPVPLNLRILVSETRTFGGKKDLVEAGAAAESMFREQSGDRRWSFATTAISLFEDGGDELRASALKQRVRQDFDAAGKLRQVSQIRAGNKATAIEALKLLCSRDVMVAIGASFCVSGAETGLSGLAPSSDRATAQEVANAIASAVLEATLVSPDLLAADPAWRARVGRALEQAINQNLASSDVLWASSRIELERSKRVRILERGHESFPGDFRISTGLANEYISLARWDDATRVYQSALAAPAVREDERRTLEQYIRAVQERR